jgi:hypothetical protein
LIRADLGLSYGQIGLLAAAPLLLGSIMELPLGVLDGRGQAGGGAGRRRHPHPRPDRRCCSLACGDRVDMTMPPPSGDGEGIG